MKSWYYRDKGMTWNKDPRLDPIVDVAVWFAALIIRPKGYKNSTFLLWSDSKTNILKYGFFLYVHVFKTALDD